MPGAARDSPRCATKSDFAIPLSPYHVAACPLHIARSTIHSRGPGFLRPRNETARMLCSGSLLIPVLPRERERERTLSRALGLYPSGVSLTARAISSASQVLPPRRLSHFCRASPEPRAICAICAGSLFVHHASLWRIAASAELCES